MFSLPVALRERNVGALEVVAPRGGIEALIRAADLDAHLLQQKSGGAHAFAGDSDEVRLRKTHSTPHGDGDILTGHRRRFLYLRDGLNCIEAFYALAKFAPDGAEFGRDAAFLGLRPRPGLVASQVLGPTFSSLPKQKNLLRRCDGGF